MLGIYLPLVPTARGRARTVWDDARVFGSVHRLSAAKERGGLRGRRNTPPVLLTSKCLLILDCFDSDPQRDERWSKSTFCFHAEKK